MKRRIEPSFDKSSRGGGLSATEDDRVLPRRKSAPARSKPKRGKKRSAGGRRGLVAIGARLAYWCLVLMLWAGIGAAGMVAWYGAKMPALTTWSIPGRSPNIKIVVGRRQASRQPRHDRRRSAPACPDVALYSGRS